MKPQFSYALALAMTLSICGFTAQADVLSVRATNGQIVDVSMEAINEAQRAMLAEKSIIVTESVITNADGSITLINPKVRTTEGELLYIRDLGFSGICLAMGKEWHRTIELSGISQPAPTSFRQLSNAEVEGQHFPKSKLARFYMDHIFDQTNDKMKFEIANASLYRDGEARIVEKLTCK